MQKKLFKQEGTKQVLIFSMVLERISVFIILSLYCEGQFESHKQFVRKMMEFAYSNYVWIIRLILLRLSQQSSRSVFPLLQTFTYLDLAFKTQGNNQNLAQFYHYQQNNPKDDFKQQEIVKHHQSTVLKIIFQLIYRGQMSSKIQPIIQTTIKNKLHEKIYFTEVVGIMKNFFKINIQKVEEKISMEKRVAKPPKPPKKETLETDEDDIYAGIMDFTPVDAPYLPSLPKEKQAVTYTLVLDLDETLVHYQEDGEQGKFLIRPFAYEFLEEMAQYYEVIIFTAATQDYADWILNLIDKKKSISYRFYRRHTVPDGMNFVKDLTRIGRDIKRMIIIDNVAENFQKQPDNGIFIRSWYSDLNDTALVELAPLLKVPQFEEIVKRKLKDVRVALRNFRERMLSNINSGLANTESLNIQ